jgi:hypothetical protein
MSTLSVMGAALSPLWVVNGASILQPHAIATRPARAVRA